MFFLFHATLFLKPKRQQITVLSVAFRTTHVSTLSVFLSIVVLHGAAGEREGRGDWKQKT
jgi:hypothetical protein